MGTLGRLILAPNAILPHCSVFLASLGKTLGVYFFVWPNFHFLAIFGPSKMPKIKILKFFAFFFELSESKIKQIFLRWRPTPLDSDLNLKFYADYRFF